MSDTGRVLLLEAERLRPVPRPTTGRLIRDAVALLAHALADHEVAHPPAPAGGYGDRLEDFAFLRGHDVPLAEAGARVGVRPGTARRYEAELRAQKESPSL